MNKGNIFGTICPCGEEVFCQRQDHPYAVSNDFKLSLVCSKCGKETVITKQKAIDFYEKKVRDVFSFVSGSVLEIGCGGGFLTKALLSNPNITKIVAVDKDDELKSLKQNNKLSFVQLDLDDFDEKVFKQKFDFVVCKDVLMQLKDCNKTFGKISKIARNFLLLNWFNRSNKNCSNKNASPIKIKRMFENFCKETKLSYPKLYNWCYLISAKK